MKMQNGLSCTQVCFVPFVGADSDDKRTPDIDAASLRAARVRAFGVSSVESDPFASSGSEYGSEYVLALTSDEAPRRGSLRVSARMFDVTPGLMVAWLASMGAMLFLGYALAL